MKNVVVATDLSARSAQAVRRAASLLHDVPGHLTVLHVLADNGPTSSAAEAEAAIRAQIGQLPADAATIRIARGKHFDTILATANEVSADLVVIGKHRSVTQLDLFRGSTGERTIRFGTRPVLLVKQEDIRPYRRILIGVDFSPSSRSAVEFAVAMFPKSEFVLMHAYPGSRPGGSDRDAQFAELLAGLGDAAAHCQRTAAEGPPAPTLMKAIAATKPDLVVLGTHGLSGSGPQQIGTVAERILSEAAIDLVAVR
jgi:nucleotide-binding universal stress UspA family protein